MEKIRTVLDLPIKKGYINWEKLSRKIFALLETVGGNFNQIKSDEGVENVKVEDAFTTHIKTEDGRYFTYKIHGPRFKNGHLMCTGFEMGFGKGDDIIWQPNSYRSF